MAGRYEDLRAAVLGGVDRGSRHGWAVLARCGMAAWIKAVIRIPVSSQAVRHRPSAPAAVAGELVEALARQWRGRRPGAAAADNHSDAARSVR